MRAPPSTAQETVGGLTSSSKPFQRTRKRGTFEWREGARSCSRASTSNSPSAASDSPPSPPAAVGSSASEPAAALGLGFADCDLMPLADSPAAAPVAAALSAAALSAASLAAAICTAASLASLPASSRACFAFCLSTFLRVAVASESSESVCSSIHDGPEYVWFSSR